MSCLYDLEMNLLSVASFANVFSHSEVCLFIQLIVFFCCAKAFKFNQVPIVYFCFYFCYSDFPGGSDGKASVYDVGDTGSIPGLGRSPGEGNGNPLQHSCLENSMD